MRVVGVVRALWRYPVKSMGGERLAACTIGASGVAGDRGWAVRDEAAGEIRGAKKLPALMLCRARYLEEPRDDDIPPAEITLPDGRLVRTDDPGASARLSAFLGRPVTLWPRQPAECRDHYRRGLPDHADPADELRAFFGREAGEPLPDVSQFAPELLELTSPPGTYFDVHPIHLLTTASLAALGGGGSPDRFDPRRFRPNVLVETAPDVTGLVDVGWCGRRLHAGGVVLAGEMPTIRCGMTTHAQPGLPKDPSVLRTIVREADQALGLYASVVLPGLAAVGDAVMVE